MIITDYTVLDLEMTGLAPKTDRIIEIGAVKVKNGVVADTLGMLVNPKMIVPQRVTELTGITTEMVKGGEDMDQAVQKLIDFIGDDVLVGHNVSFDYSFIKQWAINNRVPLELKAWDTLRLARNLLPPGQSKKLEELCAFFNIDRPKGHRALDDALQTRELFEILLKLVPEEKRESLLTPVVLCYKAKRQTPATKHQIERLKEYMEKKQIKDPVNWESLTRNEASRLQDQYYGKYGR